MAFGKKLERTLNAIHMEPVDKIPYSYSGCAYVARETGLSIAEFLGDYDKACDVTLQFLADHPGIDTVHSPIFNPAVLTTLWYSAVKMPGVDLPDDELWQMDEREVLGIEDYQKVVEEGYGAWSERLFREKLGDPLSKIADYPDACTKTYKRLEEVDVAVLNGGFTGSPIEGFCGGRQMTNFMLDLYDEPEAVKAAFDEAHKVNLPNYVASLKAVKPIGAWVGGWRAAPELFSHDMWMEFVWPYLNELIMATIDCGVIPILHFDSCWDSEMETLKELPAKTCLLMFDGSSDMRAAREILDDRMCLMGDVPATMLAFGTDSEVYDYTVKLIDDVGPKTGLIISSGCDCPLNAKKENVAAMIQATVDYQV